MAQKQTMTELRALCQSMGARWSFSDDRNALQQKIQNRQVEILPPMPLPIVTAPEDQRLRTKPPNKVSDEEMVRGMLEPYIALGLKLNIDPINQTFHMSHGKKHDTGTMRQPPRVIIQCARKVMEP